jgi:nucleoid-associated protein YgaU
VVSAIQAHPRLAGAQISVAQQGSAILLQGEVPSIALKYLLEALAKAVPGVALVDVSGVRVVYRVRSGDTLSEIALRMYGQASWWLPIMQANDLANPNRIYPAQRLVIPPPD